jgi:MFS family permease
MATRTNEGENPFVAPDLADRQGAANSQIQNGRYGVLALLCLAAAIAYVQRAAISVPASEISRDLNFGSLGRDMGWIQSAWYFSYALMQLPSGWFADRAGSRRALALLCVIWSCATLMSSFATGFGSLIVLWGVMGAAQAGAFPCAAKAIGQLFPESERARASGLLASGMAIGGAIAPVLTASLLESVAPLAESLQIHRWRLLLASYAIPGVLWTILFLLLVPNRRLPATQSNVQNAVHIDWTRLFRSGSLALLCAQQFFRAAGMVFFLTWFPTFLQKTRGVSTLESGVLTTLAGIGGVVGSLTGGFVSDWMLRRTGNSRLSRQGIAVAGMTACAVLIMVSYMISDVRSSIAVIALGAFCATFGGVSGYTVAISFGGRHVATVFSSMNMCGNFGAALFPLTAGWLVDLTGNWNLILFLFAGIMAIDAICWAFLNPRGTLFGETDTGSLQPNESH